MKDERDNMKMRREEKHLRAKITENIFAYDKETAGTALLKPKENEQKNRKDENKTLRNIIVTVMISGMSRFL